MKTWKTRDVAKYNQHVASRLKIRRQEVGVSQTELADRLGVSYQQVQKYETGVNRISVGTAILMAQILDVPVTYFLEGIENPQSVDLTHAGKNRGVIEIARHWPSVPDDLRTAVLAIVRAASSYRTVVAPDESRAVAERRTTGPLPPEQMTS